MSALRMLLANEPRAYRETMAAALQVLRPGAEVRVADPEALDREMKSFAPQLIVGSSVANALRRNAVSWIELYPKHGLISEVCVGKQRVTIEGLDLADLISIMDRTEALVGGSEKDGRLFVPDPATPSG